MAKKLKKALQIDKNDYVETRESMKDLDHHYQGPPFLPISMEKLLADFAVHNPENPKATHLYRQHIEGKVQNIKGVLHPTQEGIIDFYTPYAYESIMYNYDPEIHQYAFYFLDSESMNLVYSFSRRKCEKLIRSKDGHIPFNPSEHPFEKPPEMYGVLYKMFSAVTENPIMCKYENLYPVLLPHTVPTSAMIAMSIRYFHTKKEVVV